jgi:hypothetical protein
MERKRRRDTRHPKTQAQTPNVSLICCSLAVKVCPRDNSLPGLGKSKFMELNNLTLPTHRFSVPSLKGGSLPYALNEGKNESNDCCSLVIGGSRSFGSWCGWHSKPIPYRRLYPGYPHHDSLFPDRQYSAARKIFCLTDWREANNPRSGGARVTSDEPRMASRSVKLQRPARTTVCSHSPGRDTPRQCQMQAMSLGIGFQAGKNLKTVGKIP